MKLSHFLFWSRVAVTVSLHLLQIWLHVNSSAVWCCMKPQCPTGRCQNWQQTLKCFAFAASATVSYLLSLFAGEAGPPEESCGTGGRGEGTALHFSSDVPFVWDQLQKTKRQREKTAPHAFTALFSRLLQCNN